MEMSQSRDDKNNEQQKLIAVADSQKSKRKKKKCENKFEMNAWQKITISVQIIAVTILF